MKVRLPSATILVAQFCTVSLSHRVSSRKWLDHASVADTGSNSSSCCRWNPCTPGRSWSSAFFQFSPIPEEPIKYEPPTCSALMLLLGFFELKSQGLGEGLKHKYLCWRRLQQRDTIRNMFKNPKRKMKRTVSNDFGFCTSQTDFLAAVSLL